jgi:hypothetical protein
MPQAIPSRFPETSGTRQPRRSRNTVVAAWSTLPPSGHAAWSPFLHGLPSANARVAASRECRRRRVAGVSGTAAMRRRRSWRTSGYTGHPVMRQHARFGIGSVPALRHQRRYGNGRKAGTPAKRNGRGCHVAECRTGRGFRNAGKVRYVRLSTFRQFGNGGTSGFPLRRNAACREPAYGWGSGKPGVAPGRPKGLLKTVGRAVCGGPGEGGSRGRDGPPCGARWAPAPRG